MFTPGSFGNAHNCYFQALADAGWLALAVYLIMLTKIVRLAWRFSAQRSYPGLPQGSLYRKPLECSMFLLVYCLAAGMDSSGSAVPLAAAFYWMNIIIAIILGISARLFILSRSRYLDPTRQFAA
jgi:O-antigen ligase